MTYEPPSLTNSLLAVCDFETTGVDTASDIPIELGIVYLDPITNLPVGEYETLINPRAFPHRVHQFLGIDKSVAEWVWLGTAVGAHQIHKIGASDVMYRGAHPSDITGHIQEHLDSFSEANYKYVVLTSDNIQFEFQFMRLLYSAADSTYKWPFHYCGWDTSLMFNVYKDGKDPDGVPHRALPDTQLLVKQLQRCINLAAQYNRFKQEE